MQSTSESLKQIKRANKIVIISHINADADAICSSMALKALILKRYKNNKNLKIDILTDTTEFNELYAPLISHATINTQRYKRYDLAIALDSPSLSRLGKYKEVFIKAKDTLLIDHHDTCENFAFNNLKFKASSTCEAIYLTYIKKRNFKVSSEILRLIYAGIITDTNDLSQNVYQSTHQVIADLLEKDRELNLSLEFIHEHFFKNSTKQKMALLERALKSLSFYENDKIAMMKILKQDLNDTGCKQEDTLGIVDYALKMKDVYIGIIFIKQEDNSYYVSLRSKGEMDVSKIAKEFNGGGHLNMAAFQTNLSISEIKPKLINLCKEQFMAINYDSTLEQLFAEEL